MDGPRIHALEGVHDPAFGGDAVAVRQEQIGTIGCCIERGGRPFLLTSGHVLAPTGFEPPAAAVYQPGPSVPGMRRIGAVLEVASLERSPTALNTLDVGLATVVAALESLEHQGFRIEVIEQDFDFAQAHRVYVTLDLDQVPVVRRKRPRQRRPSETPSGWVRRERNFLVDGGSHTPGALAARFIISSSSSR